jgi:hypothetical protein
VIPFPPRTGYRVIDAGPGLAVEMPSPRRPLTALALCGWLAGWAVGDVFVAQQFAGGEVFGPERAFLVAWALVWALAGVAAAAYVAWLLAGRERVTLAGGMLTLWSGIGPWGIGHAYPVAEIRELRPFGREVAPVLAAGLELAGRGASGVRFRHGDRVVRFARALDEPAARALVELMRAHPGFARGAERSEQPAA